MKWIKELKRDITTTSQFLLYSNVYDIYPLEENEIIKPLKLNQYIAEILKEEEYHLILLFEPLYGIKLLYGDETHIQNITKEKITSSHTPMSLEKFVDILEKIDSQKEYSVATIFNYSSRIENSKQLNDFYYRVFRLLQNTIPKKTTNSIFAKYNLLLFVFDKENDIPAWYITDNPKIKSIPIPKPDFFTREIIIKNLSKRIKGFNELDDEVKNKNINIFIEQTNGLYLFEILSIISLAVKENIDFSNIFNAINMYRLGIIENEWAKIPYDKLLKSEEILSKRVIGQNQAINKVSDILKRAYFNLSGSQYSKNSNRPKGIMFFAGPTGVGKTELAKSITELIFGSENNYIRFDMSEFSQEHSNQRLIGAPPGYVGYETGGELINAIKENPFSVILFDEIEKAHPKIMDIFLQILDDGRITSGRGETVYLSETIIIFTSNLGIYEIENNQKIENVNMDMSFEDISKTILNSINNYFKYQLQRPEILNRIGENIVVFDFIRENIAVKIFDKMLNSILLNLKENHKIELIIDEDIKEKLKNITLKDLSMGGRGIGNHLENSFINPLSRALFEYNVKQNDKISIKEIKEENGIWKLILEFI